MQHERHHRTWRGFSEAHEPVMVYEIRALGGQDGVIDDREIMLSCVGARLTVSQARDLNRTIEQAIAHVAAEPAPYGRVGFKPDPEVSHE